MLWFSIFLLSFTSAPAQAQEGVANLGGDTFASGSSLELSTGSPRDLFAAAFSAELGGRVEGDLHATGFDVEIDSQVGADFYAAGFSVDVGGPVGSDLTVTAGDFSLKDSASVAGNARIIAGSATLDAPILGALLAKAGSLELNGTVAGDAELSAGHITFGPQAKIGGTLTYRAREPIDIPSTVAPDLAHQVADQLMAKDALGAHARDELGLSEATSARPIQAALTSAATFAAGAALPLAMVFLLPQSALVAGASAASLLFLALLGALGARTGGANVTRATLRVAFWGALAMALTAGIGAAFGTVSA